MSILLNMWDHSVLTDAIQLASQVNRVYLRGMSIHTATGEASRVYSISQNGMIPHLYSTKMTLSISHIFLK